MLEMFGRFHLLALHLPIGFLLLAFLLALKGRRSAGAWKPAVRFSLFWAMIGAVVAAVLGYLLANSGGYDETLLTKHQWAGFTTAGLSVALYALHQKNSASAFFFPLFTLTLLSLGVTGHYGGSITHGHHYLSGNDKPESRKLKTDSNADSLEIFTEVILPVLEDKCGNCHNPARQKGGLILLTREGILKGGDSGPVVLRNEPMESPMLTSILLPAEDESHMPPAGKKQLSETEKQLIGWWVLAGAPMNKKVADCQMPEHLITYLQNRTPGQKNFPDQLKFLQVDRQKLGELRSQGILVQPVAENSLLLQVSFSGKKNLSVSVLQELKKVGKNIVQLDFGHSNLDDAMLSIVKELPHLYRLYLENTLVTDAGLVHLKDLTYLEYLNLYQTRVTDAGLATLRNLPNLRSLYLWETPVTRQGAAALAASNPGIYINMGVQHDSIFGEVTLKAPVFTSGNELFQDTTSFELDAGFGNTEIRFTTDGSDPDSSGVIYKKPVLIASSCEVKAKAYKPGWQPSEIASRKFLKIQYRPAQITLATQPGENYQADGGRTLIDLKRGAKDFRNGGWLGFQGEHCIAILDLGKATALKAVHAGAHENTDSWIFFPEGLRISTSPDGKNFVKNEEKLYAAASGPTLAGSRFFTINLKPVTARFIKIEILSNLKNPAWHPAAGEPCWVFIDEIVVE